MLRGRKIIIGITGGIAAYKIPFLIRLLKKKGAEVKVVMSPSAGEFVTKLTLATLSGNAVHSDFIRDDHGSWNSHVKLGLWGDLLIMAPATANTLAKMANGNCDNLLMAVYLSARCPVMVAPAMDLDMYRHRTTRSNIALLQKDGVVVIPPGTGELASGLSGEGRMAEPGIILGNIESFFKKSLPLSGIRALVTAGPTYEPIDDVRFIGNHSSGKMGISLADALNRAGAEVTLVAGPGCPDTQTGGIHRVNVRSAEEMRKSCMKFAPAVRLIIKSAAVADLRPVHIAKGKLKKERAPAHLALEPTADILAELGKRKKKGQILIGFALESDDGIRSARAKLRRKNLDAIVLNSLQDKGAGFGTDTNKITLLTRNNKTIKFELKPKAEVAKDIVNFVIKTLGK
ncbi:MAG: bifunctional phosphopantothenoylcysteine decarboxylase/phosphopantothenate--cysteine ligase CoaBC [Bacteroidia bacterium]|nr:bifunctional phosphopantothenoylcysteine decarboxylase/phosphopantothenate--cysteine ligase CoaBC [Bacteroidia bacterium]